MQTFQNSFHKMTSLSGKELLVLTRQNVSLMSGVMTLPLEHNQGQDGRQWKVTWSKTATRIHVVFISVHCLVHVPHTWLSSGLVEHLTGRNKWIIWSLLKHVVQNIWWVKMFAFHFQKTMFRVAFSHYKMLYKMQLWTWHFKPCVHRYSWKCFVCFSLIGLENNLLKNYRDFV